MAQQLPLPLGFNPEQGFAQFWPGPNHELIEHLRRISVQPGEALTFLWGPSGRGKTHLLNACCSRAAEHGRSTAYLPLTLLLEHGPEILDGLESYQFISLDDVERVAGRPTAELALFHLFNRARDQGQTLAMAATLPPAQLPIELPDLASRLTWGLTLPVRALCGDDTLQALSLRASHLGLQLPPAVGRYLMNRAPRDLPAQLALLDRLDQASLAAQRRLTIPFVKSLLEAPP